MNEINDNTLIMSCIKALSLEQQRNIAYEINKNTYYYVVVDIKRELYGFGDMSCCEKIHAASYDNLMDILKSDYNVLCMMLYDENVFCKKYKGNDNTDYDGKDTDYILDHEGFVHGIIKDIDIYNKNTSILNKYYENNIYYGKLEEVICRYTEEYIKIVDGNNMVIYLDHNNKKIIRKKIMRDDSIHNNQLYHTRRMFGSK
uniref:Uncharacterized protein n=1 Tax=Pithovirus LCPAC101 TaxID=2506586 RepID=A0A481Z5T8_9VIRU|nr:MAG: hypothetical protein LCPAC101_02950 [Pithovirus LCPAC101]